MALDPEIKINRVALAIVIGVLGAIAAAALVWL